MARRQSATPTVPMRQWFERFVQRARELDGSRLVREQSKFHFSMKFDAAHQQMSQSMEAPDDDYVRSYLLGFRKFLMKSEPVFIEYIIQQALRCLQPSTVPSDPATHTAFRQALAEWKDEWHRAYRKRCYVNINGKGLTAEVVTGLVFYGGVFHDADEDKNQELASLLAVNRDLFVLAFHMAISELHKVLVHIGINIEYGLIHNMFVFPDE